MNTEYWESKFKTEGTLWQFEPSDSALLALDIFQSHNIGKILIPGVGYGRNAKIFLDQGFDVTGIEIARSAIELAGTSGLHFKIHHGSVTSMPFDNELYDGIFCYFLWHEQQEQFLFVADLNWSASLERDRRNESCTGLQKIKIDSL